MTGMRSTVLVVMIVSSFAAGCASNRTPPTFRDVPASETTAWSSGRRLWSDGSTLHVAIDEDPQGLFVGRLDYEVWDGNLYLSTVRVSKPFSPGAFQIDTTGLNLKHPWQDHVYWVAEVQWDHAGRRIATVGSSLGQHVDRVKAEVAEGPGEERVLRSE
jgi:hypothetical protein